MSQVELFHLGIKALIIDSNDCILVLKVNLDELPGYGGAAYWDIPGGRVHRGDTMEETLRREIVEETGIGWTGRAEQIGTVQSNIRIPLDGSEVGLALVVYRCPVSERPDVKLSEEHVEWAWLEKKKAADLLGVKYPLEFTEMLRSI